MKSQYLTMRVPEIGQYVSLREISPRRIAILGLLTLLLIGADLLGTNPYADPDTLALEIEIALGVIAIAMAVSDRLSKEARREWRNRAILVAVALVFAAVSSEAATRWVFRNVTTSADGGGFFSRRWAAANSVFLNSQGFRERQFSLDKPEQTYRIAAVGDSFTFGNGLRTDQRYSDLLERWLPDRFEVLNFGAAGANLPDHLETLSRSVAPAHPDYVLLQWYVNDAEGYDLSGRPTVKPLLPFRSTHNWLQANSALYSVLNIRWIETQVRFGLTGSYERYMEQRLGDPNGADARLHDKTLHRFISAARERGFGVGVVLFPDSGPDMGENYPFLFLHERVRAICREEEVTCLDLLEDFSRVKDRRELWVSPFDHHPSAKANEIAALKILEVFAKEWERP